jgi:hypothetical protein
MNEPHAAALFSVLLVTGCGTVEFEAPPGAKVRILEIDEPVTIKMKQKVWYAGWGQWPLSNNSTAPLIAEMGLEEVRLATDQDLLDTIVSAVTSIFSFSVRTMYVEGNPWSGRPPPAPAEKAPDQGAPAGSGS